MSKNLKIAIALMLLSCTFLTLCSCVAKPKLNLEDAADNLKDENYTVYYVEDAEDNNPRYQETLNAYKGDEGISIIKFTDSKTANLYYENLKLEYDYKIDSLRLQIETLKHQIKKYEDDLSKEEIKSLEKTLENCEESLEKYKEDYCFGKSGKTVWYGTKDAAKDSRG